MSQNGTCPYWHAGPYPQCPLSYADLVGTAYDNIQVIYAVLSALLSFATFVCTAVIISRRKLLPLDTQKRMFYLSSGLCVTLIIRSVDPAGWRLWLPETLSGLMVDWGSALLYSLVFTLIHDWIRIVMKITGRGELANAVTYFFYFLNGLIWIPFTILSILQTNQDAYYVWRGIKLIVGAIALILIVLCQSYFGYVIFSTLRDPEKLHARSRSGQFTKNTNNNEPSVSGKSRSVSRPTKLSAGKRSKISRIRWLLVLYGACETAVLLAQFATASQLYSSKNTLSSPPSPPTTASDVLYELLFDWAHMLAVFMLLMFFHPPLRQQGDSDAPDEAADDRNERSEVRPTTSTGSGARRPPQPMEERGSTTTQLHFVVNNASDESLPAGWQLLHNDQGVPYYYNQSQHLTVWERPGGALEDHSPSETDKLRTGGSSSADPSISI